ncbi:hypothetical protein [Herbidospora mongoliensis]|uniref:hypothetical protein n=1 Tax=Herbidospora mongoliensis TaxID=688067 RepID=UPI0012F78A1A|nr:hypothetical protein [Herbidospora mongoliensis]
MKSIAAAVTGVAVAVTWPFVDSDLSDKYLGPVSLFAGFAALTLLVVSLSNKSTKSRLTPFIVAGFSLMTAGLAVSLLRHAGVAPPVAAARAPLAVNYGMVHITHPVDGRFTPTCSTVSLTAIPPDAGKLWLIVGGSDEVSTSVQEVLRHQLAEEGRWQAPVHIGTEDPRDADHEYDIRVYWVPDGSTPPTIPAEAQLLDEIAVIKDPEKLAC